MIVRGPEVSTSQSVHKVGLTNAVWFPPGPSSDQLQAIGGHRNDSGVHDLKLGGQDCESCRHPETIYNQEQYWEELRLGGSEDDAEEASR